MVQQLAGRGNVLDREHQVEILPRGVQVMVYEQFWAPGLAEGLLKAVGAPDAGQVQAYGQIRSEYAPVGLFPMQGCVYRRAVPLPEYEIQGAWGRGREADAAALAQCRQVPRKTEAASHCVSVGVYVAYYRHIFRSCQHRGGAAYVSVADKVHFCSVWSGKITNNILHFLIRFPNFARIFKRSAQSPEIENAEFEY